VALRDIGMKEADLDRAAHMVVSSPYWNPREIGVEQLAAIQKLLQNAYEGVRRRTTGMMDGAAAALGGSGQPP